jgi:hydrogenase maturation protease
VGLAAIRLLRAQVPEGVDLVEAGVPDVDLLALLEGRQVAVLVDALQAGLLPGTVKAFTVDDLPPAAVLPWSLHGFGLAELLQLGYLLQPEKMPRYLWLVGIQAGRMAPGELALSPPVAAALPEAVRIIRQLLAEAAEG